jgi:hypothetical protein
MRHFGKVAVVFGLLVASSCGGESDDGGGDDPSGGGGGGGSVDTGLPETTALEDVTPQQYASACEALREEVSGRLGPDRAVRGICEVYGAALTDDPAQCRSAADGCVDDTDPGPNPLLGVSRADLDFTQFECGDTGELEGCSVTVGEFETCLEDQMAAIEALITDNDCDNAANVGLAEAMGLISSFGATPPSCTRVQDECPGVGPFGDLPAQ